MLQRRVMLAIASAFFSACGDAQYRDVSADPEQKGLINQTCEVTSELRAHGVAQVLNREKKTDYVSIWNPGFSGPELTFLVLFAPDTRAGIARRAMLLNNATQITEEERALIGRWVKAGAVAK